MAIRLRRIENGKLIAVCAALTEPKDGDLYLDDEQHYALAQKHAHEHGLYDVGEYAEWMEREQGYRDAAWEQLRWSEQQAALAQEDGAP